MEYPAWRLKFLFLKNNTMPDCARQFSDPDQREVLISLCHWNRSCGKRCWGTSPVPAPIPQQGWASIRLASQPVTNHPTSSSLFFRVRTRQVTLPFFFFFFLNCVFDFTCSLPFLFWTCEIISTFFLLFFACLLGIRNQHFFCTLEQSRPISSSRRRRRDAQGSRPFLITKIFLSAPRSVTGVPGAAGGRAGAGRSGAAAAGRGREEIGGRGDKRRSLPWAAAGAAWPRRWKPTPNKMTGDKTGLQSRLIEHQEGGGGAARPLWQPGILVTFRGVYHQNKIGRSRFFHLPCRNWGLLFNPRLSFCL